MWKLLTVLGSIIALSWDDILEAARDLLDSGVSWGGIITAILLYNKLRNNKRFKEHDERLEAKQRAIMAHLGVPWDWDAEKKALQSSSVSPLYRWLHKGLYHARDVVLYTVRRVIGHYKSKERRRMNISKAWIVGLIGYIAYFAKTFIGIEVPDELIDKLADFVLLLIMILPMIVNMVKKGANSNDSSTTGDHGPMR